MMADDGRVECRGRGNLVAEKGGCCFDIQSVSPRPWRAYNPSNVLFQGKGVLEGSAFEWLGNVWYIYCSLQQMAGMSPLPGVDMKNLLFEKRSTSSLSLSPFLCGMFTIASTHRIKWNTFYLCFEK